MVSDRRTWLHRLVEGDVGGVLRQRRAPVQLHLELVAVFRVYQLHHALVYDVRLHTHTTQPLNYSFNYIPSKHNQRGNRKHQTLSDPCCPLVTGESLCACILPFRVANVPGHYVQTCMTSSTKPEIHNVSKRRQRRTERRP